MEGHSSQFLWQLSIPLHIKHCPDKKNAAWKLPLFPLLHLGTTPITVTDTVLHCIYRNKTFSTFYIPGPSYWSLGSFHLLLTMKEHPGNQDSSARLKNERQLLESLIFYTTELRFKEQTQLQQSTQGTHGGLGPKAVFPGSVLCTWPRYLPTENFPEEQGTVALSSVHIYADMATA